MAQKQFNPPFDRSAPCPACQSEVRGISALIHNLLNRCDVASGTIRDGKAWEKLWDLRNSTFPAELTVPHPAAEEIIAVGQALVEATEGMMLDGLTIKASPEIRIKVEALIQRAAKASDAFVIISDVHFEDSRHSSGSYANILRESQGSKFSGHFHKKSYEETSYHHTVAVVAKGEGDIRHQVCGTELVLHDHFKAKLAADPEFYDQVWCPTCRMNVPFFQFDNAVSAK